MHEILILKVDMFTLKKVAVPANLEQLPHYKRRFEPGLNQNTVLKVPIRYKKKTQQIQVRENLFSTQSL